MDRRAFLLGFGAGGAGLVFGGSQVLAYTRPLTRQAGKIYVVSPSGKDTNDGLSADTALKTIQAAAGRTNPGDTVLVMTGDYTNTASGSSVVKITRAGAPGSPITYAAYPGHTPRIVAGANNWQAIKIMASYITIAGFEVAGNGGNISYDYALSQKDTGSNPATNGTGIEADGRSIGILHHLNISNNRVHHFPGAGISAIAADYVTISGNTVSSCAWWSPYESSGISVYSSRDVDFATTGYKVQVLGNTTYDNENYIPCKSSGKITDGNGIIIDDNKNTQQTGVPAYKGRTLVANNLSFNNGGTGMHAYSSSNVNFVNNTAYWNNRSPALNNGEINAKYATTVRLYNNILYARTGKKCQNCYGNTDVYYDYNVFFNGSTTVRGSNDVTANPQFVDPQTDPALADFRISKASAGSASGTSKLAPPADIIGTPRPSGRGFDRGAYQGA